MPVLPGRVEKRVVLTRNPNASPPFYINAAVVHRCITDRASSLRCSTKPALKSKFQASCFINRRWTDDLLGVRGHPHSRFYLFVFCKAECGSPACRRTPTTAPITCCLLLGSRIYCRGPARPPPTPSFMLGIAFSRQEGQGSHYWPRLTVLGAK